MTKELAVSDRIETMDYTKHTQMCLQVGNGVTRFSF